LGFGESKFPIQRNCRIVRRRRFDIDRSPVEFVEYRPQKLTGQSASEVLRVYYQTVDAQVCALIREFNYGCQAISNTLSKKLTP